MWAGYIAMFSDADEDNELSKYYRRINANMSQQANPFELANEIGNMSPASFGKFSRVLNA